MNLEEMTDDQLRSLHEDIKAEAARRRDDLRAKVRALREVAEDNETFATGDREGMGRGQRRGVDAYRQCAEEGLTMYRTAKRLGVTVPSVMSMRDKYGLQFAPGERGKRK